MAKKVTQLTALYKGLKLLMEGAFPKRCNSCGKDYATLDEFIDQTRPAADNSGLKQSLGVEDQLQVELFRNCTCGSTLMEEFGDRRSIDELGQKRRQLFDHLLNLLLEGGMPPGMAKGELLKVMKGRPSELLNQEQLQRFFS
jgi:hypothetical protein